MAGGCALNNTWITLRKSFSAADATRTSSRMEIRSRFLNEETCASLDVPQTSYPFSRRSLERYAPSCPDMPVTRAVFMKSTQIARIAFVGSLKSVADQGSGRRPVQSRESGKIPIGCKGLTLVYPFYDRIDRLCFPKRHTSGVPSFGNAFVLDIRP